MTQIPTGTPHLGDFVTQSQLSSFASHVDKRFEIIESSNAEILREIRTGGRTNWSALAGWATVLLTACGLIGGLVAYGLNVQIRTLREQLVAHEELRGHSWALESHAEHKGRLTALETYALPGLVRMIEEKEKRLDALTAVNDAAIRAIQSNRFTERDGELLFTALLNERERTARQPRGE